MERSGSYEVGVAFGALDALIDAVHAAAERIRGRSRLPVPNNNVVAVAVPAVTDLAFEPEERTSEGGRPVAAIAVSAGLERTDVVFALDPDVASANFSGSDPLSCRLATASAATLTEWGLQPRVTRPITGRSGVTGPSA